MPTLMHHVTPSQGQPTEQPRQWPMPTLMHPPQMEFLSAGPMQITLPFGPTITVPTNPTFLTGLVEMEFPTQPEKILSDE